MSATATVPFMDLRPGADAPDVQAAIQRVIDRGWFILGPELAAFEDEFAAAMGGQYAVGVGTGTDAIALLLRALGIGPGDEVITPSFTYIATTEVIALLRLKPVFVEVDPHTFCMDPESLRRAITPNTKLFMFSSPCNPSGSVYSKAEAYTIGSSDVIRDAVEASERGQKDIAAVLLGTFDVEVNWIDDGYS